MKSLLKVALVSIFILAAVGLAAAQSTPSVTPNNAPSFAHFNLGPCDFSNQFYSDNGMDSANGSELNSEPDGRFGTFRQFGPPATGNQANWVADEDNCSERDPTRRDFRILATTGGNSDDNNSPFTCADLGPSASPGCANQPSIPETVEFISILAFIHNQIAFVGAPGAVTQNVNRVVGFINGGLQGVQQNPGETIAINPGTDAGGNSTGVNPRGISTQYIVGNFEAYAALNQFLPNGQFASGPCSVGMNANQGFPVPTPCFPVNDTIVNGHTLSDVATPNLRQDWRFATNRNAMDGSDGNCINNDPNVCGDGTTVSIHDSPFGYFCDDLLGMWVITYFWFVQPQSDPICGPVYQKIGALNGFSADGFPIILTAHELNDDLEGNTLADGVTPYPCGAEGQEDVAGGDGGAAWLVCPAIPDPRNGGITSDAFLDVVRNKNGVNYDTFLQNQFSCLQKTGKFCFESAPGQ